MITNRKSQRVRIIAFIFPALLAAILFSSMNYLEKYLNFEPKLLFLGVVILFFQSAAMGLLLYLKGDIHLPLLSTLEKSSGQGYVNEDIFLDLMAKTESELKELTESFSKKNHARLALSKNERIEVIEELKLSLTDELVSSFEENFSEKVIKDQVKKGIKNIYQDSTKRLDFEIQILSRRANLNLVIGVLTTSIAVALLVYMVLGNDTDINSTASIVSYYLPRISVAIFVEVFSFFFLRLYKSNLNEIKYYQNEIIKLSLHRITYEASEGVNSEEIKADFIKNSLLAYHQNVEESVTKNNPIKIEELSKLLEHTSKAISSLSKSASKNS